MSNPKILIIGTGSLLNYGCEGIVQGTYALLQEHWHECELIVASDDIEHDKKLFSECKNIYFVPYKKRFTPYRLIMGVLRRLKIGKGSAVRMNDKIIDPYDILLSAGGDNFAEAPDGSIYNILKDLIKIGERTKRKNKMYVVWGASVGPFNQTNYKMIVNHLKIADIIFPRERLSYNYLTHMGLITKKIYQVADPAFWMKPDFINIPFKKEKNQILIGLNISQLAISHGFTNKKEGKELLFKSLDALLKSNPNYTFLCIPHVMSDTNGAQNDSMFMDEYSKFSPFEKQIETLKFGLGARKTKSIISQCDLLIASRMHCCVAGISSSTPTLLLTYSQKGIGMTKYAYGNIDMSLPITEIDNETIISKVEMIINTLEGYKTYLKSQQNRFKNDAAIGILKLKKKYSDITGY